MTLKARLRADFDVMIAANLRAGWRKIAFSASQRSARRFRRVGLVKIHSGLLLPSG